MGLGGEMDKHDGGPAFPWGLNGHRLGGLTFLDWFAGQALSGEMATYTTSQAEEYAEDIARRCYAVARAMVAERNKGD